jgi:biopolymer transport protein ExbD
MKIRSKQGDDIAIDMSPMIDMVFLLLIFFLVASQIVKVDKISITVPEASAAIVPDDETGRFLINVGADDKIYIGSTQTEVTIPELTMELSSQVAANPQLQVVIRADESVKYETTEKIMVEACATVGISDMIFAAFGN